MNRLRALWHGYLPLWLYFAVCSAILAIAYAQTPPPTPPPCPPTPPVVTPVTLAVVEPRLNVDGTPIRPQGYIFYNVWQGATVDTITKPLAINMLPGQQIAADVKNGPCFTVSAVEWMDAFAPNDPPHWSPTESAPAKGGCKPPLADSTAYNVIIVARPW